MMRIFWTFTFTLLLFNCSTKNEKKINEPKKEIKTEKYLKKQVGKSIDFEFSKFKIMKGSLGPVKVGMTIRKAEEQFSGLIKKEDEAFNFGFDGGGPAYLYYLGDEILFGLIPGLETDKILFIIAAHNSLRTTNGLNPNSTVKDLIEKYPSLMVSQDLMNGWEFFNDNENNWGFVFMTNEQTEIGEYPVIETPSKPKKMTTKTDWITIK